MTNDEIDELASGPEAHVFKSWRDQVYAEIERLKARIAEFERDTRHMIELRDDGFTIQHPLSCRPDLFSCGFNMAAGDTPELGQMPNGRYYCIVDDLMTLITQEEVAGP